MNLSPKDLVNLTVESTPCSCLVMNEFSFSHFCSTFSQLSSSIRIISLWHFLIKTPTLVFSRPSPIKYTEDNFRNNTGERLENMCMCSLRRSFVFHESPECKIYYDERRNTNVRFRENGGRTGSVNILGWTKS